MTASVDLTTTAAVKQWLGLASTADDTLIGGLVTAVSQAILADLGRGSLLPGTYTETHDGGGCATIALRQWPVTQVVSVSIDGAAVPASSTPGQAGWVVDVADPMPPGTMQRLHYRGGVFARGRQNVVVSYRAGYEIVAEPALVPFAAPYTVAVAAPFGAWCRDTGVLGTIGAYTAAAGTYTFASIDAGCAIAISYGYVPMDLAQASVEWAADRYSARSRIGQSAKTLGGQETTSFIVKAMPDVVERLLRPYRRVAR